MKRTGLIAVLGLSLVALVAPAVSAHGGHDGHGDRGGHHGDHSSLQAFASNAEVGGTMVISAAVGGHHRTMERFGHGRGRGECGDIVVSAVVNFQSGHVTVDLPAVQDGTNVSRHFFQASVGVPGEEPTGDITVDVTATCGDRSAMVTVPATITEGSLQPPPDQET